MLPSLAVLTHPSSSMATTFSDPNASSSSGGDPIIVSVRQKRKRRECESNKERNWQPHYKGVCRHKQTGNFEVSLWDKDALTKSNKKGKRVYLGVYTDEEEAARTYDLAALKYWGRNTILNYPASTYEMEYHEMQKIPKEAYVTALRRESNGFTRGASQYRGVTRVENGKWEARIGGVIGYKFLYLGTYDTEEKAAELYDLATLFHKGPSSVTNLPISHYKEMMPLLFNRLVSRSLFQHSNETSPFEHHEFLQQLTQLQYMNQSNPVPDQNINTQVTETQSLPQITTIDAASVDDDIWDIEDLLATPVRQQPETETAHALWTFEDFPTMESLLHVDHQTEFSLDEIFSFNSNDKLWCSPLPSWENIELDNNTFNFHDSSSCMDSDTTSTGGVGSAIGISPDEGAQAYFSTAMESPLEVPFSASPDTDWDLMHHL